MVLFSTQLYNRMQEALGIIAQETSSPLQKAEKSYYSILSHLRELKEYIRNYEFIDQPEEIQYFKEIKPKFLREILFYIKLLGIETHLPIGIKEQQIAYYQQQLSEIQNFFEENQFLYMYYRMGKSHMDSILFVRQPADVPLLPEYSLDVDEQFSNIYTFKLSQIQAFEDLIVYLKTTMDALDNGQQTGLDGQQNKHPLTWTGTKAQFIEFAYGLQSVGVLNNNKADVKQVMEWLQYCFNIKVSNYYGYFQSIRIRKKSRTPFYDNVLDKLKRRMDESDENPRYQ